MNWIKEVFGRIWAFWALLIFAITLILVLIPVCIICLPMSEPNRTLWFIRISRVWMGIFLPAVGCPLKVTGRSHFKKGEQYVVVCNHNALMDVPISSPAIPGGNKTIAKAEMARIPIFGIVYKLGSVLVDRKSDRSRKESYNQMKAVLNMGLHMCIYPEGTRNTTGEPLKSFHDGAFRLALDTRRAIIPGIIFHTRKVNPPEKAFYLMPHPLRIDFLEPIEIREHDTCETLKTRTFEIMKAAYLAGKDRSW